MALTFTTLTNAIANPVFAPANIITLGSVTGLLTTSLIMVDGELMVPKPSNSIDTTALTVQVLRGQNGTAAVSHGAGTPVAFGNPDDFQDGVINPIRYERMVPTAQLTTAGALTYTAGQLLSRRINRDPNGASRTDTLPTAVLLVQACPGARINDTFSFEVVNQADAAETITVAVGTGGTAGTNTPSGADTLTVAQNTKKRFRIRFTGIAPGAEAYTLTDDSGAITY